ncbi:MAG: stage IV sporulation protein A [Clostridia bacterium]
MKDIEIYKDISKRTNGDIYIGVVGPVRTGKSTFIKNFMQSFVIPNIQNEYKKDRALDELPQSASGKTIMTTEPKFIPNESVEICLDNNVRFKTRLVDCVGYLVDGAVGHMEDDMPRMVKTPWSEESIPFSRAAEIGTKKVITDHSTIGIVVTTDGSITDIDRKSYVEAEERVIRELKQINKPYIVILNSTDPNGKEAKNLEKELSEKYNSRVISMDIENMKEEDFSNIFERVLEEFPVTEIGFDLPEWFSVLNLNHWLKQDIIGVVKDFLDKEYSIREINQMLDKINENDIFKKVYVKDANMESGNVKVEMDITPEIFYRVLSEESNFDVKSDADIFSLLRNFAETKSEYDKIAMAMEEVRIKGYGIITPTMDELKLEEPEIVKQGNKYGVKLKASAPSIHMIRADIETEVSPIVGSEKQSEDLVKYLLSEFETDPKKIWESNIFGKSLHELVNEGLHNKLYRMPDEAQMKLQETLQKIINEGSGGLICIIL